MQCWRARQRIVFLENFYVFVLLSRLRLSCRLCLLSVAAILMTVSLFVRSETNTKMLDSKFTLKIQEMGDALESVRAACQVLREDRDISNGR